MFNWFPFLRKCARRAMLGATAVSVALVTIPFTVARRIILPRAAEFVVVVGETSTLTTIERDDLSKIFLKRIVTWPNGTPADPVDLPVKLQSRVAFTTAVHRKSVGAIRAFWQQQIFSGRDVPPPEKATEAEVVTYVRNNPNAVGYVSRAAVLAPGVRIITVK